MNHHTFNGGSEALHEQEDTLLLLALHTLKMETGRQRSPTTEGSPVRREGREAERKEGEGEGRKGKEVGRGRGERRGR